MQNVCTDVYSWANPIIYFTIGFPIALSYPHFYKSDQSLLDSVDGLSPNQKTHETYFLINPVRL